MRHHSYLYSRVAVPLQRGGLELEPQGLLLRKDLPAVRQVGFRVDDSLDASPLQSFFTQSGAGLATIVADPAHIVTADGSHWFPGATLPTGHHLVSVAPNAVTFEKDGRMERITP